MKDLTKLAIVEEAITGNEQYSDPRQPRHPLAEFYRAINSRDLGLMEQNWSTAEDSSVDNPLGGIKRGWAEIRSLYEALFHYDGAYHFEFCD